MAEKKVLVLGAGLVSRPLVRYLLDDAGFNVVVATRTVSKAEALIQGHERGKAVTLDVSDQSRLSELVKEADLAVSLLPYVYHVMVAELCLDHGRHMVTTSYVSDEMKALDGRAKDEGLLLLNEIGLDPGIDHMSAMRIIDKVESKGGKVTGFWSYCGGLPAPDANDNPFGYKFSWSPRGVLMAGRNPGLYLQDGREVHVAGDDLFGNCWVVDVPGAGEFEAYPNRNSLQYIDLYGLQGIRNMLRGTLRNKGWCRTLKAVMDLDLLEDETEQDYTGMNMRSWLAARLGCDPDVDVESRVASKLGLDLDDQVISNLKWLGLFSDEPVKTERGTALDVMCAQMLARMPYKEGERDMIVLHHEFEVEQDDGTEKRITSTLVDFGIPGGDSAMARTVSLPAAIAARLILQGELDLTGVHIPVSKTIYEPVLEELERLGIECKEVWS